MKYLFYKGKVAAAVALGLSLMLSTSAFAAQETEETVPAVEILTAEEAAAKAAQEEKELTKGEFKRLVEAARRQGKEQLALCIETIAVTGIRISELQYFTVERVKKRKD